jgi:hypothetical protein
MTAVALGLRRSSFAGAAALLAAGGLTLWEASSPALFTHAPHPIASALSALAATFALYLFVARCISARAGLYAVLVLSTMPIWFLRARGDGLSLSLPTIVLAALGTAAFDPRLSRGPRVALLLGGAACGVLAAKTSGLVIVLGAPAIAVGVVCATTRFGRVVLALGVAIALAAAIATIASRESPISLFLFGPRSEAAFTAHVAHVAYGLEPWSCLAPFALARRPDPSPPETARAVLVLVLAGALMLALEALGGAPATTVACGAVAGSASALLADLDRSKNAWPLFALGACVFGGILAHDVSLEPDRVTGVLGATMPTGLASNAARLVRFADWAVLGAAVLGVLAPLRWLRRGALVIVAGAASGAILRVHAYPDLVARTSPARALGVWLDEHKSGDALGLLGIDETRFPGVQAAAGHDDVIPFRDRRAAATWVAEAQAPARRFLLFAPNDLPWVNAAFRARGVGNVPIISASGAFLLGVNALGPGEKSESPMDRVVGSSPPEGIVPIAATLGEAVEVVGWSSSFSSRSGHVRVAARITKASMLAGHCTFLHVDHTPTRYGAEHRTHPYPMDQWRDGDVIVDDFEVDLPPHFHAGRYDAYWGVGVLPCQDDRRLPVTMGPTDGHNRVALGKLEVR